MIRLLITAAVALVIASPSLASGPTRAAEVNIDLVIATTRVEAEAAYPGMSSREIDLLLHRICEHRAIAMLDL